MKRSCSSVPQRVSRRVVRLAPEPRDQRAQQQLLRQAHPRVRRHLERAHLEQAAAARRAVRRVELVDAELGAMRVAGDVGQQVTEQPIDEPGRNGTARPPVVCAERDLELVDAVVPGLVDARRLAGRADEEAGEQIRQRRMVVPVRQQAAQQIRAAAGTDCPPASRRRARSDCRRRCRRDGRRS